MVIACGALYVPPAGLKAGIATCGCTVIDAVWVAPPKDPEMVTVVWVDTGLVLIAKVTDRCPAATWTVAGGSATPGLLLDRVTVAPPLGATVLNVAVSITELPPVTDWFGVMEKRIGGGAGTRTLLFAAACSIVVTSSGSSNLWDCRF
jgi:hypothetical protein